MSSERIDPMSRPSAPRPVVDAEADTGPTWRKWLRAVWNAIVGAIGLVLGLVPHILHHVTVLAGTALVAGSGGTALFGVLGLLASIPLLLRLRRRFGTWRAPAIGLLIFAAMFSVSTFVIGPAISGAGGAGSGPVPNVEHTVHHDDPTPTAT